MPILASVCFVVYFTLTFVLRTWLHWRRTGRSGFVGARPGAPAVERVAALAMVLVLVLAPIAPWVGAPLSRSAILVACGGLLCALGLLATLLAQRAMRDSWRIGVDPGERPRLVTEGPFARVRNPVFSAMLLASLGFAALCPTPLALALPVLAWLTLELQVRGVEEPYLRRVHGEDYTTWAARTGRFLPRL